MSRTPSSHSGRSGNPKIMGSSQEHVALKPGRVKSMTLKLILVNSQPDVRHYQGRARLVQCQDTVADWDSRSWCPQPGIPVTQQYKVLRCCQDINNKQAICLVFIYPLPTIYLYLYIYRYIDRHIVALSSNPKEIDVAVSMPSSEIMFQKRALYKYVHIYACVGK